MTLNLNNVLIGSSLNLSLTVTATIENQSFLLLRDTRVLGALVGRANLVLRRRMCEHSWVNQRWWRLRLVIQRTLADSWPSTSWHMLLSILRLVNQSLARLLETNWSVTLVLAGDDLNLICILVLVT